MCGLWKQKVFNWPEQLKESTRKTPVDFRLGCAWGCRSPAAALHVVTSWACMHWGWQQQRGHVEPQPLCLGNPPGLGLGSDLAIKALVGAKVGTSNPG